MAFEWREHLTPSGNGSFVANNYAQIFHILYQIPFGDGL